MATSANVTNSQYRLKKAFRKVNESVNGVSTKELTKTVQDSNKLLVGKVVKWFSPTNQASVKILGSNKVITCTVLREIISENANVSYTPKGTVLLDDDSQEYYVEPNTDLYCVVCELKIKNPRYIFLGFINHNLKFKENSSPGEYTIEIGKSKISLTNERINISTPHLFINGLNYKQPKLDNYYEKHEMKNKMGSYVKFSDLEDYPTKEEVRQMITEALNEMED